MKSRKKSLMYAIIISTIHCVLGNLIGGSYNISSPFLEFIFLPYSFIAGLSNFAGWDSTSIVLEFLGFIVMTSLFFGLVLFIKLFMRKDS